MNLRLGIDAGGTFTDLVAYDSDSGTLLSCKSPSTPEQPIEAFLQTFELAQINPENIRELIHGTTIATNALIERKGANVAFVTTSGFEDMPYIQRINRRELYNLGWEKSKPLVASRKSCFGLEGRILYDGTELRPLQQTDIESLCQAIRAGGFDAVAVCLLFSYLNAEHEQLVRDVFEQHLGDLPFSISHEIAPTWREYERASTTIADAYLKPLLGHYIHGLDEGLTAAGADVQWSIMKSNGGIGEAAACSNNPIQLAMSGPAGGMIASQAIARALDITHAATVDMGGTSCDVGIVVDGEQRLTTAYEIEFGLPASIPLIDVKTIGAGGGSIAWVDAGGFLQVGPRSAGARPGPVCYGLGGTEPTVTDANLLLGRLDPEFFLDGRMRLRPEQSRAALGELGAGLGMNELELSSSILQIAEDNMASAIRMVSIGQGYDPRDFTLIAFGGAGPLHATAIARNLDMPRVAIPVVPGNASAYGFLLADPRVDKIWTRTYRSDTVEVDEVNDQLERMRREVAADLSASGYSGEVRFVSFMNLRYLGQNYEHDVPVPEGVLTSDGLEQIFQSFNQRHETLYGYAISDVVIELVSFQVTAYGDTEKPSLSMLRPSTQHAEPIQRKVYFPGHDWLDTPITSRASLEPGRRLDGPAVIQEAGSTTVLRPGDRMQVHETGILLIDVGAD
jgi:N-methylhydantoinase A